MTPRVSVANIKPGAEVTTEQLQQCSNLFSSAYGIWSAQGRRPHRHVTASARRLKLDYLFDPKTCGIVVAKDLEKECLVGQAFYVKYPYSMDKEVIWITQLVVREDHHDSQMLDGLPRRVGLRLGLVSPLCCESAGISDREQLRQKPECTARGRAD